VGERIDDCPSCGRPIPRGLMEKHHLRTRRTDKDETEFLCRECHKTVHALFRNQDLRDPRNGLDSVEGLLADERFAKAVTFIKKVPPGNHMTTRESRHRHKRKR